MSTVKNYLSSILFHISLATDESLLFSFFNFLWVPTWTSFYRTIRRWYNFFCAMNKKINLGSVDWSADGKFLYIRNYKSLKLINCWKLIFNKFYGFVPGIPGLVFIIHCRYNSYYVFICINTPKNNQGST